MEHRGLYIKEIVKKSGLDVNEVIERIGISRSTLFKWYLKSDLDNVKMFRVAKAINHDIAIDFPEIDFLNKKRQTTNDVVEVQDNFKVKYYELLEKYNVVLEENRAIYGKKEE
jgi:hypothetical protein